MVFECFFFNLVNSKIKVLRARALSSNRIRRPCLSIIIGLKCLTGLAFFVVVVLTDHQLVYGAKKPIVIAICNPKMRTKTCLQFEMQLPKANWQIIG